MAVGDAVNYDIIVEAVQESTLRIFEDSLLKEMQKVINPKLEELAKAAAETAVQKLELEYSQADFRQVLKHVVSIRSEV